MEEKDNVLCPSRSTTRHTPLSPVSWLSRLGFKWRLVPSRLSAKPTSKSGTWGQRFKSQCGVATTRKPQVCNYRIAEVMMHIYIDQFCCQCFLFMEAIKLRLSIEPLITEHEGYLTSLVMLWGTWGQVHSFTAPLGSVWSMGCKTEWIVLGGRVSVNLSRSSYTLLTKNSICISRQGEVDLWQSCSDLDPDLMVGTSIISILVFRSRGRNLKWGPYG